VIIQLEDWNVSKRPLNLTFLKCHTKCLKVGVFLETPQQRYNSSALNQCSVEGPLRNFLLPYKAESFVKYLSSSFYRTSLLHVATFSPRGASTRFWVMASPYGLRDHSLDTPHSVGLLWTSGQPDAETSIQQHVTLISDRHLCPRRDSCPQAQLASEV